MMRRRQFIDVFRGRVELLEAYPAERWLVEVLRPGTENRPGMRRVLVMSGGPRDRRTIEKFFDDITLSVAAELVHITIDEDGRELTRSVMRARDPALERQGVLSLASYRGRR